MGFLARRKALRAQEQAATHAAAQRTEWAEHRDAIADMLAEARDFSGTTEGVALNLKKGEVVFLEGDGAMLVEPRHLPGTWEGRSQGVSFRVAKGVRYHVGANKGHFVQGAEVPTPIDTGVATISNMRVVFQGAKQTREWRFDKLLGYQNDPNAPWTAIQVSNRQKTSGILYDDGTAQTVRWRLQLALAHHHDDVPALIEGLEKELDEHRACEPPALENLAARSLGDGKGNGAVTGR